MMNDLSKKEMLKIKLQHKNGFTLIEVMVTIFILAIGMLGVAGMQAVGVRESGNLYHRTQADLLITDIVDRMRANRDEVRLGTGSGYEGANTGAASLQACGTACTEVQLAGYDVYEWSQAIVNARLPGGLGFINHQQDITSTAGDTVGSVVTVTILWDEDRTGNTPAVGAVCNSGSSGVFACSQLTVQI